MQKKVFHNMINLKMIKTIIFLFAVEGKKSLLKLLKHIFFQSTNLMNIKDNTQPCLVMYQIFFTRSLSQNL